MIGPERRRTIFLLYEEGMGVREISRRLHVSRNAVRAIVAEKGQTPTTVRRDKLEVDPELLRRLYSDCDGYIQRIHEKLTEEEGVEVGYSTLTRRVRELGLGAERDERCGRVDDVPGAEMQHDTSPYTVRLGDRPVKVVGSLLYLRYCKRKYLKFSRRFDRFRMKCFLHEALLSWGHAAATCVIDNTNLARLRGTGSHAVIVPEMETFAQQYGFRFLCHEKGHCDRKAGEERSFRTLETSFFPGRRFTDLQDMNRQALDWSTVRMDNRPVKGSGLIPAKAFEHERAFLVVLPPHLPAPFLLHQRGTDQYGFAALDTNFYWVPGTRREDVTLLEYADHVKVYRGREFLVEYPLPPEGTRNQRFCPRGTPHPDTRRATASGPRPRRRRGCGPCTRRSAPGSTSRWRPAESPATVRCGSSSGSANRRRRPSSSSPWSGRCAMASVRPRPSAGSPSSTSARRPGCFPGRRWTRASSSGASTWRGA